MSKKSQRILRQTVLNALKEDLGQAGDITTDSVVSPNHKSVFELVVNEDCVISGLDVFKMVFKLLDKKIVVAEKFKNGDKVKPYSVIALVCGKTRNILKGERTALNFISHLSGVSTLTSKMVGLIKNKNIALLDTRKTTPNLRFFEKQSIKIGGGKNHRLNLTEMILIKDNHIKAAGGIKNAILRAKKKYDNKSVKIEVEVNNIKELKDAISLKPSIIMLDNWKVEDLKNAIKIIPANIYTEASGQISADNIKKYADVGVNYISTSYMVKNSKWIDFSLNLVSNSLN